MWVEKDAGEDTPLLDKSWDGRVIPTSGSIYLYVLFRVGNLLTLFSALVANIASIIIVILDDCINTLYWLPSTICFVLSWYNVLCSSVTTIKWDVTVVFVVALLH